MFRFQRGLNLHQRLPMHEQIWPNLSDSKLIRFETINCRGILANISAIHEATRNHEDSFLSPREHQRWQTLRAENYRNSWLSGRICAKLLWYTGVDSSGKSTAATSPQTDFPANSADSFCWQEIEVISRDSDGKGIPPELYQQGKQVPFCLSISHTDEMVLVVIAKKFNVKLGCDLIPINSVTKPMKNRYFQASEFLLSASNQVTPQRLPDQHLLERIWAAKETAYKILNTDRPFRPAEWLTENVNGKSFLGIDTATSSGKSVLVRTHKHKNLIVAFGETCSETPQSEN